MPHLPAGPGPFPPVTKVRKGGGEEIPLIQVKEQQLHFAGAALKRYPMPKARGRGWGA